MDLRNKLLKHKPKVTEIEILGEKYYVRALSVGDEKFTIHIVQLEIQPSAYVTKMVIYCLTLKMKMI